jgi:hypothetical protein
VIPTGYTAQYGLVNGRGDEHDHEVGRERCARGGLLPDPRSAAPSSESPIFLVKPSETLQQFGGGVARTDHQEQTLLLWRY